MVASMLSLPYFCTSSKFLSMIKSPKPALPAAGIGSASRQSACHLCRTAQKVNSPLAMQHRPARPGDYLTRQQLCDPILPHRAMVPPVFAGRNRRGKKGGCCRPQPRRLPIRSEPSGTRASQAKCPAMTRTGKWGTKLKQNSPNLRGSCRVAIGLVGVLVVTAITSHPAQARHAAEPHHFRAHVMTHGHDYSPPYSAIVVDANSGNVLHSA